MKYIIFKDTVSGLTQPVLFGEHTSHSQIRVERAKPVSAGFFTVSGENDKPCIYGESDSLNLTPATGDLEYILMALADVGALFFIGYPRENVSKQCSADIKK
jgi:hypothetical protein